MTTEPAKRKRFDCVEMMHRGGGAVQKELAGKSLEAPMAYWGEGTQALLESRAQLRKTRRQAQG